MPLLPLVALVAATSVASAQPFRPDPNIPGNTGFDFSTPTCQAPAAISWLSDLFPPRTPAAATTSGTVAAPGGVNKAGFDRIKAGMTSQEVAAILGRGKSGYVFVSYKYSQLELWDEGKVRVWVEYEPTVAAGRTTRASLEDYSTTPPTHFALARVATREECATVVDVLIADARTRMPLCYSDAFTKQIPVDGPRAIKFINDHPDYLSYHLLIALRKTNPAVYQTLAISVRASVLCSTLREQDFFDDWGSPERRDVDGPFWGDSEVALLECGAAAVPHLLALLDDLTSADDSEYEEQPEYEYRRADYAFRYLTWILKLPFEFEPEEKDRDEDIAILKRQFSRGRFTLSHLDARCLPVR
jgi:hypothetical protein